ncbi:MAG: ABC transporter ATP-binding protein [Bacteroidetes bacterium]|nr:MAG: ABC transporter ATP-binding protein [Bacteroidota bacterium]
MLLDLESIHKGFGNPGEPSYRPVLDGLSFSVSEGESIAILGPSGSGKTTLLNLVGGLDYPSSGSVRFRGEDITGYSREEMDRFRNREIGFVFQFHHLLPQCTILENILVPTLALNDRGLKEERTRKAEELMERVGIWEYRDRLPGKLSGGECQRAAVVRAMINGPSLLLADEPTGALDRENVDRMAGLLLELNRDHGLTLLVVTHSAGLAGKMGQILELKNGRLHEQ